MCFSKDGKTLYLSISFKPASNKPLITKIAVSKWTKSGWPSPEILNLSNATEGFPVLSPDETILYYSTNANSKESSDYNIWQVKKTNNTWSEPTQLVKLNSSKNDRLVSIDYETNSYYLASNRSGNFDIYESIKPQNEFTEPIPVTIWNSSYQEEHTVVYSKYNIAFIQRANKKDEVDIFYSFKKNGKWIIPKKLLYNYDYNQVRYYAKRFPFLSFYGTTLYLTTSKRIWRQHLKTILKQNKINSPHITNNSHSLKVRPRWYGEAEIIGGIALKTNNGISISKDLKTVYISQFISDKDSTNELLQRIFVSKKVNGNWSYPTHINLTGSNNFKYHPKLSLDEKRLLFNSRPANWIPSLNNHLHNDIWFVNILPKNQYTKAERIAELSSNGYDDYAIESANKNIYFRSDRLGGKRNGDIYMSEFKNNHYSIPIALDVLNSISNENDITISPDEKIIIFNRYFESSNEMELFVSVKSSSGWTQPRLISEIERQEDWELTPTIFGKYLYYEVDSNILRIELSSILNNVERKILI